MKKFEDMLNETIKESKVISQEARQTFDKVYQTISLENKNRVKSKLKRQIPLFVFAVVILFSISLAMPSIIKAMTSFLNFEQVSKSLQDKGYVVKQSSKVMDENIEINLQEVYASQNEIGLHFSIQLPEKSKLANENFDFYAIDFAIKNGDGSYLVDLNSGFSESSKNLYLFNSIVPEYHFDSTTNQLDLTYRLRSSSGEVPLLENSVIQINRLSANYPIDNTPGLHERKEGIEYEEIRGFWELPIDTSKIQLFNPLEFIPTELGWAKIISGIAYPNSFVIISEKPIIDVNESNDAWIQVIQNNQEVKYFVRDISTIEKDGKEYYQVSFDYQGYNDSDILILHFGDTNIEFKLK